MKTLHLTNAWHSQSGGIATFYRELIAAAPAHDRQVTLVVPAGEDGFEQVNTHARIWRLRSPRAPFNRHYRLILPHRYLVPSTRLQRILREEQPDLIEITDKYSLPYLAGLIRREWLRTGGPRPVLVGLSCERMDENVAAYLSPGAHARAFAAWYMKWIYFAQFDHHIAVSNHTAAELRAAARSHLVRRGVWVMPMGTDVRTFSPALRDEALREQLLSLAGGHRGSRLLVYAGRLAPEKNLLLLAETLAARRGEDWRLVIAGTGIAARQLRDALEPGRFALLGHIEDRARLAALLASCDVFVHPNPREPFGIAPLEAMASGLPLVAPDQGGVTTYADPSVASLAPPDAASFAAAVRLALRQPPEKTARALARARQFAWPAVIARYFELYEEIHARFWNLPCRGIPPAFFSTPGDWLGREAASQH